jgi:hypothetical protein
MDRGSGFNTFHSLEAGRVRELITDPLLSSSRVLDGLFYKGAVVVEGDSDARFYQAVSRRLGDDLDLHFVTTMGKQPIPKVLEIYREFGVRSAGIVDIDVLNDAVEFEKQTRAVGLGTSLNPTRASIAKAIGETPENSRLDALREGLAGALRVLDGNEKDSAKRKSVERVLSKLLDEGKPWHAIKRDGATAIPLEVREEFHRLRLACARNGLFINPSGQLESLLKELGIPDTSEKKAWILLALQLLPGLQVERQKDPWKFVIDVNQYFAATTGSA